MKIAFRTDATPQSGVGHVMRCLALADELRREGVSTFFVSRHLLGRLADLIVEHGHTLLGLGAHGSAVAAPLTPATFDATTWLGVKWEDDAADTQAALARICDVNCLVVDHYGLDANWHCALVSGTGARIAVIDDLADRDLETDLLIDHNPSPNHAAKYQQHISSNTRILGGPRYALLGSAYANAQRYEPRHDVRSIGIFMGGADASNASETALRACHKVAEFTGCIELVTTRANPRHDSLAELARDWPRTSVLFDLPDLATFFARHDLQIGAGGGATWERCCIGAPTVGVVCAENQLLSMPLLHELGAVAMVGDPSRWRNVGSTEIAAMVRTLMRDPIRRRSLSERSRALVDGYGARRVAHALIQLGGDSK